MKIYYKKRFYSGLFSLLLGLANPVTCLLRGWERFDWKDGILCVLLILTGLSWFLRSLDREKAREDRDEDRDERNHWIELRSKATSYRVMFWMNAAWMIGCILGYTVAKDEIYIQMGLPCMVLWIAAGAARLVSELYYEQKS